MTFHVHGPDDDEAVADSEKPSRRGHKPTDNSPGLTQIRQVERTDHDNDLDDLDKEKLPVPKPVSSLAYDELPW